MELGYVIGWAGVFFGLCVPIPQLIKIYKTRSLDDIALGTYALLFGALVCYFIHAWYIASYVFMAAQAVNLLTNGTILVLLIRHKMIMGKKADEDIKSFNSVEELIEELHSEDGNKAKT